MRLIYLNFFSLLLFLKSYGQCDTCHFLTVERFRISTYGDNYIKPVTRLEERRKYQKEGNQIYQVNYYGEFSDSTVYTYEENRVVSLIRYKKFTNGAIINQIENVNYIYKNGIVNDVHVIKTEFADLPKEYYLNMLPEYHKPFYKDSLNLLKKDFGNIDFDEKKHTRFFYTKEKGKIVIRRKYLISSIEPLLFEYGVPHNSFLKTINLYSTKEGQLFKDEFQFENLLVNRNYNYDNGVIKGIDVTVIMGRKKLRTDSIRFIYK